ncbi:MAG: hypothetical protein M5U07_04980 [Xanthobacteraceae bacterium]|nr:hypothetical protein [Xanthobacteraceae bacterium]
MNARKILATRIEDLVPRAVESRPLPVGGASPAKELTLKANIDALLKHSSTPVDPELLELLRRQLPE